MVERTDPATDVGLDRRWRGTAARQANLPPALRALHQAVLTAFLDTGVAPAAERLDELASRLGLPPGEAFARLGRRGPGPPGPAPSRSPTPSPQPRPGTGSSCPVGRRRGRCAPWTPWASRR